MGRGKKRRTRNEVSSPRLRSFTPRYVTLPTTHLNDLLLSHTQRRALLSQPTTVRSSNVKKGYRPLRGKNETYSGRSFGVGFSTTPVSVLVPRVSVSHSEGSITKNVCESRQERKEVIFATNQAGKSGQKRARWTERSYKRCK